MVMSGLALLFPTFFKLPNEIRSIVHSEYLIIGLPMLGITLSLVWFILINSNLRLSTIKYEALKKLEDELEYQFFKYEWKLLGKYGRGKTYGETSYFEMIMPILFFIIFTMLLHLATASFPDKPYSPLNFYPGCITGAFSFEGLRSWQIDKEIRGLHRWSDRTMLSASGVVLIIFVFATIFLSKFMGCSEMAITFKEAGPVSEKSVETSSEKTTNEAESVIEKPTESTSEEATKQQPTLPDEHEQNGHQ